MKNANFLPMTFLAVAMAAGGAMVATAQETTAPGTAVTQDDSANDTAGRPNREARAERGKGREGREGRRGGRAMMGQIIAEMDANDDGEVTVAEVQAYRTAKVTAADTSGDGTLSIDEFTSLYGELTRNRMVDAFQRLDADGDGAITAEELDTRIDAMTQRLDRDGDGTLDLDRRNRG